MAHLLTWILVVVILAMLAFVGLMTLADVVEPWRRRWWRYRQWTPEARARLAETRRTLEQERGRLEGEEPESRWLAWAEACFWGCLVGSVLFGLLGFLWHPLWGAALILFFAWIILWTLGWVGLIGWFALDSFGGFRPKRPR